MKATRFEFRFRVAIITVIYCLGFFAPWERYWPGGALNLPRLWSWLSLETARTHLLTVGSAYLLVTAAAVALAVVGAALRVWATAYLSALVMRDPAMQAASVVASGPYRYLRNPLYVGMLLVSLAIALLMPASGALIFGAAMLVFTLRLIGGEEAFLGEQQGEVYLAYRRAVPSLLPKFPSRLPASPVKARWVQAVVAECFFLGTAGCFAALAWTFDAGLLTRSVLVCFGVSLVVHAVVSGRRSGVD